MRYLHFATIAVLLLLLAVPLSAENQITVSSTGGNRQIPSLNKGSTVFYSLGGLNSILIGDLHWKITGYSAVYALDTNKIMLTIGSPFVNLNGHVYNLRIPVKLDQGDIFVPARSFTPLLNLTRPENITWDGSNETLRIDAEWFNITDMVVTPKDNGILIEIYMSRPLRYEVYESEGNWLNIDFAEGRLNRSKIVTGRNRSLLRKINAFQFENSAQISFRTRRPWKRYSHSFKTDPGRLVIAIEDESFDPDKVQVNLERIGPDEKIDVIVLDPGHGGKDFGAIGRRKRTREKDVVLEIALELAKLIRKDKQFKVVMTRTKDEYVSLEERARIANEAKADLYLSIHCNSYTNTHANGFEVFYLAPAKNDEARAVAQFENAPFLLEESTLDRHKDNDLAVILNDMIQTEFLAESADLAYMCDMELRKEIKEVRPRGIDHAAFVVLNQVYMPSILVETAFISNEKEEGLLREKKFRRRIAEGIYNAIKRFKAKYERI